MLTGERASVGLGGRHVALEDLRCVLRDHRHEPDARGVLGRVREVAVVERDEGRLEERVAEAPLEERAGRRRVGRYDVVRHARRGVVRAGLRDEVARVDGELRPADLEGQRVGRAAWERGGCVGVRGEGGGDG